MNPYEHTGSGAGEPHHAQMYPATNGGPVNWSAVAVAAAAASAATNTQGNTSNSSSTSSMPPSASNAPYHNYHDDVSANFRALMPKHYERVILNCNPI